MVLTTYATPILPTSTCTSYLVGHLSGGHLHRFPPSDGDIIMQRMQSISEYVRQGPVVAGSLSQQRLLPWQSLRDRLLLVPAR